MSTGIDLIAAERQRQIDGEGFTCERDDSYTADELAEAAICYAIPPNKRAMVVCRCGKTTPVHWPKDWSADWWKPGEGTTTSGRIRELAKAGALIAAEIDRLQRLQQSA